MIPVTIEALLVGNAPEQTVVVLRPYLETGPNPRVLPIHIGMAEAVSISMAVEGKVKERPQTHDLTMSIIEELGGHFQRAIIDRVDGMTFFAKVVLEQDGDTIEIDARPSDAIAMAVRADAPIYVEAPVFVASSLPFNARRDRLEEREFEAFHDFVENLDPDDFIGGASE